MIIFVVCNHYLMEKHYDPSHGQFVGELDIPTNAHNKVKCLITTPNYGCEEVLHVSIYTL